MIHRLNWLLPISEPMLYGTTHSAKQRRCVQHDTSTASRGLLIKSINFESDDIECDLQNRSSQKAGAAEPRYWRSGEKNYRT